jgi:hypothetical protein
MAKVTKVEGLKSKGARIKPYEKMGDESSESAKKAPHDQLKGGAAKKIPKKEK